MRKCSVDSCGLNTKPKCEWCDTDRHGEAFCAAANIASFLLNLP